MRTIQQIQYESSWTSKIQLYRGGLWETITGKYLNKMFDQGEKIIFDFNCLFDPGEENRHRSQQEFHKEVESEASEQLIHFDYFSKIKKSLSKDYLIYNIIGSLAPLFALPIPIVIEYYLKWLGSKDASFFEGGIITATICLLSFLQVFLVQVVWIRFARLSSVSALLNKVASFNLIKDIICRKILGMSVAASRYIDYGRIGQLIENDSFVFSSTIFNSPYLIVSQLC